ncbi:Hsp70 family protein [Phaeosphaeriaceae sp. PMI808]|nr:Hsp70 family protein [Phaeosphaeriaceae sp. PMI808]
MAPNQLVIGLDYGTTYTGVSFCETSKNGSESVHIETITNWPAKHTRISTKEKVPSEVAYQKEGIIWGSLIPTHVARHMWTKLQLDGMPTGEADKILREVSTSTVNAHLQTVEIVADFLSQIKAHLIKTFDQEYGKSLWRSLPVTLVVTVPAVWSDRAKDRTLEAVNKAGFNSLEFPQLKDTIMVSEPEAAAVYTIENMRGMAQETHFAIGDGFVVCDMGGGTVDLESYCITSLQLTKMVEATVGGGDQCGGTFVDRAFLEWLEKRLGTNDFVEIAGCRSESVPYTLLSKKLARLLQDFTLEAKSGFSGTETNYLRLPVPLSSLTDETRGIFEGEIVLKPEDMIKMFDSAVRCTYELLAEQLERASQNMMVEMKYVFMVGGFSESPYIYNKIKGFVGKQNLKAFKPAYAWSAVARGAALKGIQGSKDLVTQRKCRRHYGTHLDPRFCASIHTEDEAYISEYDGVKRAKNQVAWLVKQGQDLTTTESAHAEISLIQTFWPNQKRRVTLNLVACDGKHTPRAYHNEDVYKVASLEVDLSKAPTNVFTRQRSPSGKLYHKIDFKVEISVQTSLEYTMVVKGKKYKTVTASYN